MDRYIGKPRYLAERVFNANCTFKISVHAVYSLFTEWHVSDKFLVLIFKLVSNFISAITIVVTVRKRNFRKLDTIHRIYWEQFSAVNVRILSRVTVYNGQRQFLHRSDRYVLVTHRSEKVKLWSQSDDQRLQIPMISQTPCTEWEKEKGHSFLCTRNNSVSRSYRRRPTPT